MITAIVLVHVAADRIPEAAQAIADLDGVDEVYSCAGDVDLIAIVKVTRHEELADVIAGRLARSTGCAAPTPTSPSARGRERTPRRPSMWGSIPDRPPGRRACCSTAHTKPGHHLRMSPAVLPSASTHPPRTYLISGVLGVTFFTLSWLWWDGQSFIGSFFLELGGGAFIVFLLEGCLPSALGYAGSALAALQVTTLLEWSDGAVEALLSDSFDDVEQARLLDVVAHGPFPARRSLLRRVSGHARAPARAPGVGEGAARGDGRRCATT